MGIVVSHSPDPNLLARAAYIAGDGQRRQWEQEMSQRERMQQRAIAANLYSQQAAQSASIDRQLFGYAMDDQRAAKAQAAALEGRKQLQQLEAEDRMDQLEFAAKQRRDQQLVEMESAGNADIIKHLMGQSDAQLEAIRKQLSDGYEFEDGGAAYRQMMQQVAAIAGTDNVSGMAKAQAIYEKVARTELPELKRPDFQETVNAQTATVTTPDGRKITVGPTREFQVLDDGPPEKKPEKVTPKSPSEAMMIDPSMLTSAMKIAIDALTVTDESVDPDSGKTKKTQKRPSPEEVADFVAKFVKSVESKVPAGNSETPTAKHYRYDPATGEFSLKAE